MADTDPTRWKLSGALYHAGVVVDDLDAGERQYGELFGVEWTERLGATMHVEGPRYTGPVAFEAVYSLTRSGPLRMELVRAAPGTIWEAGNGLHHVGFWSEDPVGDRARLEDRGYPLAASLHPEPGTEPIISLHHGPQQMYIEIVSVALRPQLEAAWGE